MTYGVSPIRPGQVYGGDDISDVIMNWEGINRTGHVHMSRVAHSFTQSITVTGSNGYLILNGSNIVNLDSRGHQKLKVIHQPIEKDVIRSMVQEFGDWVTGKRPDFSSSLENLTKTVSVVEAVKTSLSGRKVQRPLTRSPTVVPSIVSRNPFTKSATNTKNKKYSTQAGSPIRNRAFQLKSGAKIPAVGLGTRRAQRPGEVYKAVHAALQAGYRSIDTAQSSGNEYEIGKSILDSGIPREEIWLTTKLDTKWHNRVDQAIDASLKALRVDYLDLYLMVTI